MIEKEIFSHFGVSEMVITNNAVKIINNIINNENGQYDLNRNDVSIIPDARSASFFAIGRINILKHPVSLVVSEDELASTLTGVTEAYYKNIPLIITSLGKENNVIVNSDVFKHVTKKSIVLKVDSIEEVKKQIGIEIEEYMKGIWYNPLLIQVVLPQSSELCKDNISYDEIITHVLDICDSKARIFVDLKETMVSNTMRKKKGIILRNSTYGSVSKFLGHTSVNPNRQYLITSYENISRDINAFSLRNIKNNTVIIYKKEKGVGQQLKSWVTKNNFIFTCVETGIELKKILGDDQLSPIVIEYSGMTGREINCIQQ